MLDYLLTEEQQMIRELARKVSLEKVLPKRAEWDETGEFPWEAMKAFAAADPYRAATHNKGIMNGIDPVVIATGNDWRAIEAGAHAYASRSGQYTSLSTWAQDENGNLTTEFSISHDKNNDNPIIVEYMAPNKDNPNLKVIVPVILCDSPKPIAARSSATGLWNNN
jgi:hypothetical protein